MINTNLPPPPPEPIDIEIGDCGYFRKQKIENIATSKVFHNPALPPPPPEPINNDFNGLWWF